MKKSAIALMHTIYWTLYLFVILFLTKIMWSITNPGFPIPPGIVLLITIIAIVPGVISFYCFYTFLFSRFLSKKKILPLVLFGIVTAFTCAIIGDITLTLVFTKGSPFGHKTLFADGWTSAIGITIMISLFALVNGAMGLLMKGFMTAYDDIKFKADLNKKNFEIELALIKSQINPHFLFNTINNIDVLIEKDATKASAFLIKLSDIMRFMLFETKEERIPLSKELTYIEKYIDLQKIRSSNNDYVKYSVEGDPGNLTIAPMLLIPFVENAFKHAENKNAGNAISVQVKIEKDSIAFVCVNAFSKNNQSSIEQNGLGNELMQKRLAMLYPEKHKLGVSENDGMYKVTLSLF